MSEVILTKQELRKYFLDKRNNISDHYAQKVSNKITKFFSSIIDNYSISVVAGFHPFRHEINTIPLLKLFISNGYKTCLPATPFEDKILQFREWTPKSNLIRGKYGILEPNHDCNTIEPDMLLVPLLAYDEAGHRLGYGGGYYDQTLRKLISTKKNITSIGVAFKIQRFKKLPIDTFDIPLDAVINEDGLIPFKK
jgi:5-formyltetrahydrofolate cyclo-ligase